MYVVKIEEDKIEIVIVDDIFKFDVIFMLNE